MSDELITEIVQRLYKSEFEDKINDFKLKEEILEQLIIGFKCFIYSQKQTVDHLVRKKARE